MHLTPSNPAYILSDHGLIKVQGKDAAKLLQGQLTCDVESITSIQSTFGAHCTPQGRIISLFYLCFFEDAYYLLMPRSQIPAAIAALKKYAIFYKVAISDASDDFAIRGYHYDTPPSEPFIVRIPIDSTRFILMTERGPATPSPLGHGAWNLQNIMAGIPRLYPETTGKFLPHDLNLPLLNAINFEKGCYTGQEIIARMHYRGKLKNKLFLACLASNQPLQPGSDIYTSDLKPCGLVVNSAAKEYHQTLALLVTDAASAKENALFPDNHLTTAFTNVVEL